MKTYKTWEVIKMLSEDDRLEFKRVDKDTKLWVDNMYLEGIFRGKLGINGNIRIDGEWELVQQPVTFMEAINSGKKITSEYMDGYYYVEGLMSVLGTFAEFTTLKVINGKWFIMEDE